MKKIVLLLLIGFSSFAQKAVYNKTNIEGKFKEYQTKSGNIIKLGDTITISLPRGENFTFITQGNVSVAAFMSNKKVIISKIRSVGTSKRGFKTYLLFGGYGFSGYIDYESALETGEIKDPFTSYK
ncbi:hypothetical protein [Flavobacterium soyangense]|uniref:FecR protein domain-containing protein n=1 Tax=Flavobacterium soyangense TaxID=2023265 RepID=A0A930XW89_9FLAO|nr:hypothetical protein [Flavobacterium soyangense]MBF2709126.1 hypothetical protein [Flavobacterium soyangense]